MLCALRIGELRLYARVGVTGEERAVPQEVALRVDLRFAEAPRAALSGSIADTVCYGRVSDALSALCREREWRLIEEIAAACLEAVRGIVEGRAAVAVSVHKLRPPVEGLVGGAVFRCGDFLP